MNQEISQPRPRKYFLTFFLGEINAHPIAQFCFFLGGAYFFKKGRVNYGACMPVECGSEDGRWWWSVSPPPFIRKVGLCAQLNVEREKFEKKVIVCGIGVSLPHHHDKGTPRTKKTKGKEKSRFHFGYFLSGKMVVGKGGNQLVGGDSKRLFPNLFIISVDFKKASCFLPERWVISFPRTFLFSRKQGKSRTRLSPNLWAAFWCMMLPSLGVGGRGTEADKIRESLASDSDSEWMSPLNTHTTESHFSVTHYLLFIFPAKYGEDTDAHSLCLEVSCTICCKDKYMRAFISLLLLLPFRQLEKNLVLFWSSSSLVCLNGEEGKGRRGRLGKQA